MYVCVCVCVCVCAHTLQVAQVSRAAKPLCWWAQCVHELLRVSREADLKRIKIEEAENRLETAQK